VTTQNLFDDSERGLAMMAAPEEILIESTSAGLSVVDVSLDRLRFLRGTRDVLESSEQCAVKQGLLGLAMAAPRALRRDLSAAAARSGGVSILYGRAE
jgi:hypothetical protein